MTKPKPPLPLREKNDLPRRRFNPKEPCNIHNPLPQSRWPFRYGAAVLAIDTRYYTVFSARMRWYHPSRQRDASSVVTPGNPLFSVLDLAGSGSSQLVSANLVFEYSNAGWKAALKKMSDIFGERSNDARRSSERDAEGAKKWAKASDELWKQAARVRVTTRRK